MAPGALPLQVLQKAAVVAVDGALIALLQPALVIGHLVSGLELVALQRVAVDGDAFLGQTRRQRVHHPQARRQAIHPGQLAAGAGDALRLGALRRGRMHHFPGLGHAVLRVLGEQHVQQCGAGARQADDEQRGLDRQRRDLRVPRAVALQPQPVGQQVDEMASRRRGRNPRRRCAAPQRARSVRAPGRRSECPRLARRARRR